MEPVASPPGFTSHDTSRERMEFVPPMKSLGKRAKTGRTKRTHTSQIKPAEEFDSAIFKQNVEPSAESL